MEVKYFIFVVIATVAQSPIALGSTNSCGVPSNTEILADLETFQFAKDTGYMAYDRMIALIFPKIISTLTEGTYSAGDIQNETVTAIMLGILPGWEALQTIQPNVDVQGGVDRVHAVITNFVENTYQAIESTTGKNYSENLVAFEILREKAELDALSVTGLFLNAMANGTSFPPKIQDMLLCYQNRITTEIMTGIRSIFYAIEVLLTQLSTGTPAGTDDCLSAIKAAQKRASFFLNVEVTHKYDIMRNMRIVAYLSQTGILPGLFAIHPIFANPVVGNYDS